MLVDIVTEYTKSPDPISTFRPLFEVTDIVIVRRTEHKPGDASRRRHRLDTDAFERRAHGYTPLMRATVPTFLATAATALLLTAALSAQSAGGLRWVTPAGWKTMPERPMRAATYVVPPVAPDAETSECVVYFFGRGQGGSVADNLERWRGQVLGADGKPAPAKLDKRQNSGLTISRIDSTGGYTGMGGPMATSTRAVPGYRLLGAVIEGPGGNNLFVKFAGPAKSVAANETQFDQLLASFRPDK